MIVMDASDLFWIAMIFAPPQVWEAFGIIGILLMVAFALMCLAYHLAAAVYGTIGVARRLIQGDRVVIACALAAVIAFGPLLVVACSKLIFY